MIVRKTLGQMHMEIKELKKLRRSAEFLVVRYANEGNEERLTEALDEFRHYDKLIDYYWQKEVEFEDMFETEQEEE